MAFLNIPDYPVRHVLTASDVNALKANIEACTRAYVRQTTLIDIVSNTSETDLIGTNGAGFTVTGGDMELDRMIRVTILGDYIQNSGTVNGRLRVKFGGTTFFDSGTVNIAQDADRRAFIVNFYIANLGASNSQFIAGKGSLGSAVAASTGQGNPLVNTPANFDLFADSTLGTIDTTTNQAIRCTWQHGTSASTVELRINYGVAELV